MVSLNDARARGSLAQPGVKSVNGRGRDTRHDMPAMRPFADTQFSGDSGHFKALVDAGKTA